MQLTLNGDWMETYYFIYHMYDITLSVSAERRRIGAVVVVECIDMLLVSLLLMLFMLFLLFMINIHCCYWC